MGPAGCRSMNDSPDTHDQDPAPAKPAGAGASPDGWIDAIITLVASRVALVEIEARSSARRATLRLVQVVAAAVCLVFAWLLFVVGGVGALAMATGWTWHWLAIAAALMHLIAALALLNRLKSPASEPSFPLTRAEFKKDRQWLENLKAKKK
jgi:uncharacterized membrane protein YqjE